MHPHTTAHTDVHTLAYAHNIHAAFPVCRMHPHTATHTDVPALTYAHNIYSCISMGRMHPHTQQSTQWCTPVEASDAFRPHDFSKDAAHAVLVLANW